MGTHETHRGGKSYPSTPAPTFFPFSGFLSHSHFPFFFYAFLPFPLYFTLFLCLQAFLQPYLFSSFSPFSLGFSSHFPLCHLFSSALFLSLISPGLFSTTNPVFYTLSSLPFLCFAPFTTLCFLFHSLLLGLPRWRI
ncbi:UNVERIFIED_CONTAM: hypothetical protein K2H54_054905 [Gekko kuhli]